MKRRGDNVSKVQVLLSTYNGEKYLADQIESVLRQSYHNITLLVRDDGSTDGTGEILEYYSKRYPSKVNILSGKNIGIVNSFWELLNRADENCDYYCFCDQDDIWLPHKVERALACLRPYNSIPAMVCTSTQVTDESLRPINVWPKAPSRAPSFYNALVQNIAVGATITMNHRARHIMTSKPVRTQNIQMHDWWAYLCVSAFGKVLFDPEPSILYRQHGNNAVGGETTFFFMVKKKWRSYRRHKGSRLLHKQAMEFFHTYNESLKGEEREQLLLFLKDRQAIRDRIAFLLKCKTYRNSPLEQLLFRFLILIGYI
jgi:glycosyltransferase involved in cell wall biosynthesis